MRRGITQEQVDQAADALVVAGERPTVEKVRTQLGTGSPNTITRMLDVWRQRLAERLQEALSLPDLPHEVGHAMTGLWRLAVDHATSLAKAQLQQEREALAQERDRVAQEELVRAGQVRDANAATERATAELHAAIQRTEDLEARLVEVRQQEEDRRIQRDRLEQQAAQFAAEVERLNVALASGHAAAKAERDRSDAHLIRIEDRAHQEIDRLRQELKALHAELASAKHTHATALAELDREQRSLQRALRDAQAQAARHAGHATALEAALARLRIGVLPRPPRARTRN